MRNDIQKLVSELTLEEKAGICSGIDSWHTMPVERLGIPSIMMTDGPHGVRKEKDGAEKGLLSTPSYPATCFPTASAVACSWDTELLATLGEALGDECLASGVSILLGPGVNIKRSPLCGRNFEYYSEDPYLAGKLAAGLISGVQSRGVACSLKHFAANNQETERLTTDTIVDERTLREIYLTNFEIAVKEAKPRTVMCAYNKLQGEFCSENKRLLTEILRDEWGFDGFVMSDWGAVNERDDGVAAGLDLEMPSGGDDSKNKIIAAVRNGNLPEKALDTAVERILTLVMDSAEKTNSEKNYDKNEHHALARRISAESIVLLKNDNILPLAKKGRLAVIGALAQKPRVQGGGSSHISPTMLSIPLDEIKKTAGSSLEVTYCAGYKLDDEQTEDFGTGFESVCDTPDEKLIIEAAEAAAAADKTVVFLGLPDLFESEGYDRTHMRLPIGQLELLSEIAEKTQNIVVVLMNGAPIEMPWLGKVKGVLETYLGGQAVGGAIADILFGDENPSGKLSETFPVQLCDNPSYLYFPGRRNKVEYREGIFVGYRYYEKKQLAPLFPFGHGLSYTTFEYIKITTDRNELDDTESVTVSTTVKNSGNVAGKEVVQFYVRDTHSSVIRPEKELKGFVKVSLESGEEKTVSVTLGKRAFAYYDEEISDWLVESGEFEILVGGSSANTALKTTVTVNSTTEKKAVFNRNSTIGQLLADPIGYAILIEIAGEELINSIPPFVRQMPLRSIHMHMPEINDDAINAITEVLNS